MQEARMSHHSTVPNPQADITDLYLFQKPDDPARSILIMNVNPFAPKRASTFSSEVSYEFKIDINADAEAEIAFHVLFSPAANGQQTATVYWAAGETARSTGAVGDIIIRNAPVSFDGESRIAAEGDYRFYAGLRSDPWFADVDGVFNNFQFTGKDTFADANILAMVLDVPNRALGANLQIGIWARTVATIDGEFGQIDQVGRPLITAVYNATPYEQQHFVETPPAQQRAIYLPKFVTTLCTFGYTEAEAAQMAGEVLPDVLPYHIERPSGYPNGRLLTDDILNLVVALMTRGKVTDDLVGPHTNLLNDFPYLGSPHPVMP
jgi:hypothetical protein